MDTHADVHVAAALDANGGLLGVKSFPASDAGYQGMLVWLRHFGDLRLVGVEGTGSYGAGLARHLAGACVRVVEVDRADRQDRHRQGKSDPLDAVSAARAALSGRAKGAPKGRDGTVEAIRALMVAKRSARSERTQTINQARGLIVTGPEDIRARFANRSTIALVASWPRCNPATATASATPPAWPYKSWAGGWSSSTSRSTASTSFSSPWSRFTRRACWPSHGVGPDSAGLGAYVRRCAHPPHNRLPTKAGLSRSAGRPDTPTFTAGQTSVTKAATNDRDAMAASELCATCRLLCIVPRPCSARRQHPRRIVASYGKSDTGGRRHQSRCSLSRSATSGYSRKGSSS